MRAPHDASATRAVVLLHPADNVVIACRRIAVGEPVEIDGVTRMLGETVDLGHKIARYDLAIDEKVVRYGASIGSMTMPVRVGMHVHLHNLKSDYIATHGRDAVHIDGEDR